MTPGTLVDGVGAPAPASALAPRRGALTREQLIRMGQDASPWEFVPVAIAAVKMAPGDAGLRFMLAMAYAKLGLGTLAREEMARLPEAARADQGVQALQDLVINLPADEVTLEARRATCMANVAALGARAVHVHGELERWQAHAQELGVLRARDGNIVVRRPPLGAAESPWVRFRDDLGEARSFPLPHKSPDAAAQIVKPYILEGIDPPWLLMRLAVETPPAPDGYSARITVVQADAMELLDGLSLADVRRVIGQERVTFVVGPDSAARLGRLLTQRADTQIAGPVLRLAMVRTPLGPRVDRIVADAVEAQAAEASDLLERVRTVYSGRDSAWWRKRYARSVPVAEPTTTAQHPSQDNYGKAGRWHGPLRVLVPTCRYSTFIRHSAADLARSFEQLGWEARVFMEPDAHSHLSPVGYLRVLEEFQPDLVVLINYTRANLDEVMPSGIPVVCWVQDPMPHLFKADVGAKQTELDFLVGHLHNEFFTELGYSRDRTLSMPVVASAHKFHDGPVTAVQRERLECEIAYVSHHSETPEALHERLVRETAREPATRRIFERLRGKVAERLRDTMTMSLHDDLRAAAVDAAREELKQESPEWVITLVMNQYCLRLADRMMRHETLRWAAEIAQRRGWRLKIFGKGWEKHPAFAKYAAGELEHGDDLRASYRCAAAHLHASINWVLHQRVMECALSGGLPLCRLNSGDFRFLEVIAHRELVETAMPWACHLETRSNLYPVADHPGLMKLIALGQRLGFGDRGHGAGGAGAHWDGMTRIIPGARYIQPEVTGLYPREEEVVWLLGDMAETTFHTSAQLEAALERAITRPTWRDNTVRGIAGRVRRHLTTDVLATGIVGLVEKSLGARA